MNVLKDKQLKRYGKNALKYIGNCAVLNTYILRKQNQSVNRAKTVKSRIDYFGLVVYSKYDKHSLDLFLKEIKTGKYNVYDLLGVYRLST
jgi:hypothetical protein